MQNESLMHTANIIEKEDSVSEEEDECEESDSASFVNSNCEDLSSQRFSVKRPRTRVTWLKWVVLQYSFPVPVLQIKMISSKSCQLVP